MTAVAALLPFRDLSRMATQGRKSPLSSHGWISSPERREPAMKSHSPGTNERLVDTESGHPEVI